jgi:hypothetical protein
MTTTRLFPQTSLLAAAVLALAHTGAAAQTAPSAPAKADAGLSQKIDALTQELATLKAQVEQNRAAAAEATAAATAAANTTVLTSYGEITYGRNSANTQATSFDMQRFVLGLQHRFDANTKLVGELEVEHGVASSEDAGEVAVEQAFIEHQFAPNWAARAGLFLIPSGLLNENHEPTVFYGVQRNTVETRIIPTTWREGGVQLVGDLGDGLTLQTGFSTGFNLGNWDYSAESEGTDSPLGSIHQELVQAKARSLSVFAALNWRGLPGLQLGGSVFTGNATHGQTSTNARVTLSEAHARWTPGRWDLAALYARGDISHTAELNAANLGMATMIPAQFDGAYAQAAYKLWQSGEQSLAPFARLEQTNTGKQYANLGAGFTPAKRPTERTTTVGANYQLTSGVVVKADWQTFKVQEGHQINLGLGWAF